LALLGNRGEAMIGHGDEVGGVIASTASIAALRIGQ
jgi:hypothetical protein